MRIKVHSYATMRRFTAHLQAAGELEVAAGATVRDVLNHLAVASDQPVILLVNGRPAKDRQVLSEHDHLVFFPPLEGG